MSDHIIKDALFMYGSKIRILIANQWNNGFPVFRDMTTGKPIEGCYYNGTASALRDYLKKSLRTSEDIDDELSFLLAELVWAIGMLTSVPDDKKWQDIYERGAGFERLEKIRWCHSVMDSLDKCFASDIPHQIHNEPITFFHPHEVKK